MKTTNIPDKLPYTKGERAAEIIAGAFAAAIVVAQIVMIALGFLTGGEIILIVVEFIIYGVFTLCSVYPQHTNLFNKPEKCSESSFRAARRGFIAAKTVLVAALFVLSLPWG